MKKWFWTKPGRLLATWLLLGMNLMPGRAQTGPTPIQPSLSAPAQALVQRAFSGLDPAAPIVDYHAHLIGTGSGCEVNPAMLSSRHPFKRLEAEVYLRAAGVKSLDRFDEQFVARLVSLTRGFGRPIKIHILAFDHFYHPDGTLDRDRSEFYVPNERVLALAEQYPDVFEPVLSVHPYRTDALAELDKGAAKGARFVKWLPNAMGIDPLDPRCDPYYRRMVELHLILLTHTGTERAVTARDAQALGNPLRLRRALDAGVKVIMAHCASLGRNEDLDHPGKMAANFDLFLRMMGEKRYQGRLFGDLSAMTQVNRMPRPLLTLLRRPDLQGRLVNGSDYPLPAVNAVIWTRQMVVLGLITAKERKELDELFKVNPLLFDFVLKRTVREPTSGKGLAPKLFLANPEL